MESDGDACKFLSIPLLLLNHELADLQDGATVTWVGVSISTDEALLVLRDHFDTLP